MDAGARAAARQDWRQGLLALGRRALDCPRGSRALLAKGAGCSVRTLRRYVARARAQKALPALGRPQLPAQVEACVRGWVEEEAKVLPGSAGWRPYVEAIRNRHPGKYLSVMVLQHVLGERRAQAARTRQKAIEEKREGYDVLARDAIWGEDTTILGGRDDPDRLDVEVVRDPATTGTLALSGGPPPTAHDVVGILERTSEQRGGPPLVFQRDNGPIYTAQVTQDYLAAHRIVDLPSRVHSPWDNGATERGIGELKADCGLRRGEPVLDPQAALADLQEARERRDAALPRASRSWKTARELDAILPRADTLVDRRKFYEEACAAKEAAVVGVDDPDERCLAQRRAVFALLEKYGLARRRVGRQVLAPPRAGRAPATNRV